METWLEHVREMVDDEITDYLRDDQSQEELVAGIVRGVWLTTTALKPDPCPRDLFRAIRRATRSPPFGAVPAVFAPLGGRNLVFVVVWYLDSV